MKDCLLIANSNAVTYKEVFPLIKSNQLRWGYNWVKTFIDTEGNEKPFGNICWFVTLPTTNKKKLTLTATYDPNKYPHYDNYNAIEVSRVKDIPYDYEGVMGVPITILGYDLENVEIIGMAAGAQDITGIPYTGNIPGPFIRGGGQSMQECLYAARVFIRWKTD